MPNTSPNKKFYGRHAVSAMRPPPRFASRLVWSSKVLAGAVLGLALALGSQTVELQAGSSKTARSSWRKLDKALTQVADDSRGRRVPVIVTYRSGAEQSLEKTFAKRGRGISQRFDDLRNVVTEADSDDLAAFEDDDDIEGVSLDADVESFATPIPPTPYTLRATLTLTAPGGKVKPKVTGRGVVVAVIDSGIELNDDFDTRIGKFFQVTQGVVREVKTTVDGFGHGSHVAGLIAGSGKKSSAVNSAYAGLAPDATVVMFRVLDGAGSGKTSDVLAALNYIRVNKAKLQIDVVNLSLGHPILEPAATDPLVKAVEAAVRAGLVVVCSAGNVGINQTTGKPGYAGITSPGNSPSAITVGALDTMDTTRRGDDLIAPYSSRGPTWYDGFAKPDFVAPGTAVTSVAAKDGYLYKNYKQLRVKAGEEWTASYLQLTGTSMSAAVTSGAVALILQASEDAFPSAPHLTPNAVKAILQFTAIPLDDEKGQPYDVLTQGAGGLNVEGAIRLAQSLNPAAKPGAWWLTTGVTAATTTDRETLAWGQTLIWGDSTVSGNSIYYNRAAWASSVVWGDNIVWGGAKVRAASVVAGESIVWCDNIVWGGAKARAASIVGGGNVAWANNIVWGNSVDWGDSLLNTVIDSDNIVWSGRK